MDRYPVGGSGLSVSALSFGTVTFTGRESVHSTLGGLEQPEASRMVAICRDAGINLFDTADMYSDGIAETMLGKALGPSRKDVLIATKCFNRMGPGEFDVGLSRRHILTACDASLKRLKTDWIDIYQLHEFDSLTPLDETLRALDDLVCAGKVRFAGCSNFTAWQYMKALAIADRDHRARPVSHQIYYSLLCRDAENELMPLALDQDIGMLIWGPLASGYLTGKFRRDAQAPAGSRIGSFGSMGLYDPETADAVVDVVRAIADERGVTSSQVALNWLLRKPGVSSVILGARTEDQLRDNIAAARWKLSPEDVSRLDAISAHKAPYPLWHQHGVYAEGRNAPLPSYRA